MKHERQFGLMSGVEKAAILFLCLGEERGSRLMQNLSEFDIQRISRAMAEIGTIDAACVEMILDEFINSVEAGGSIVGSLEMAERMLAGFLPEGKVADIMNQIRGPLAGRTLWENVSALNEQVLANYLRDEHDQTAAAILSKIAPEVAARVLVLLDEERRVTIAHRMITMETLPLEILEQLEETLSQEFLSAASYRSQSDSLQRMADFFNKMETTAFEALADRLTELAPEAFGAIKQKMFTFEDLARLDVNNLMKLIRSMEGQVLPLALRGVRKEVRETFLAALPTRSRAMLLEEMALMGPVRAKDVQDAQQLMVESALAMARMDQLSLPMPDAELIE